MTVLGENPGEEYFDVRTLATNADVNTHVAYITGIGLSAADEEATAIIKATETSVVELTGTIASNAYLVVGGW